MFFRLFKRECKHYRNFIITDDRGTTAVEFALLAIPFVFVVFIVFQTAIIYVVQMSLTFECQRMAREVRTGKTTGAGTSADEFAGAICDKVYKLISCADILVDLQTYSAFSDIPKTLPIVNGALDRSSFRFQIPPAGAIVMLRVAYELPIIGVTKEALANLSNGKHLVVATNVFKTEPF